MKDLIEEAKKRIDEIVKMSKDRTHRQSYLAFYRGEHGFVCNWCKSNTDMRIDVLSFGNINHNVDSVMKMINENSPCPVSPAKFSEQG